MRRGGRASARTCSRCSRALALLLAAIGLYGVMAQAVEQRTREIGVRMALGAERRNIFTLVIGRALVIAAVGIVVGIGAVADVDAVPRRAALPGEAERSDDTRRAGRGAARHLLLASYVPARRATRVDPWTSLRAD